MGAPKLKQYHFGYMDHCSHQPEFIDLGEWVVAVYSKHMPSRDWNEDSLAIIALQPHTVLLAVADGAGGHNHGREASQQVIREFLLIGQVDDDTGQGSFSREIITTFDRANEAVREIGGGACTTLNLVEVHDKSFRCYHSGDSKAIVIGGKGKLKYQTINHGPLELGIECGFLKPGDAGNIELRHIVTNMVGSRETSLEVSASHQLDKHDVILVGSDGLFDNVPVEQICEMIHGLPVDEAASILAELALERMEQATDTNSYKVDDISFILLALKP